MTSTLASKFASYQNLKTAIPASELQIERFEAAARHLQSSNGVYRTTFRNRFADVDPQVNRILAGLWGRHRAIEVHDWACSDGRTSQDWANTLLSEFPNARLIASDRTLHLIEAIGPSRDSFIFEPDGTLLQFIRGPLVIPVRKKEPYRRVALSLVRGLAGGELDALEQSGVVREASSITGDSEIRRGEWRLRGISIVHPEVRALAMRQDRFTVRAHSVFEPLEQPCDVIRTMNIFNRAYFSVNLLRSGFEAVFHSLREGGVWVVGRTSDGRSGRNNASIFRRTAHGFEVFARIGEGSEVEPLLTPGLGAH